MNYKLNLKRDVDVDSDTTGDVYILNLPYGWRFYDDLVHVRGYDSLKELRDAVKTDVIVCECTECTANK